jgi:hypothetical protein
MTAISPPRALDLPRATHTAPVRRAGSARRLPPAHSPLSLGALWRATTTLLALRDDSRRRLARTLCADYHADEALLTDSGTHALELAILLSERIVGERAVVALPAYSCFDMATAAVGAGARIALYDVDPDTLAPDLDSLTDAMCLGARVIVVAPLYGIPVDWEAIENVGASFGAIVIEDAAQCHGAVWQGRPLGSLGRLSVLSFGRGKGWTGGCGGALLARRGALDEFGANHVFAPAEPRAFAGFARAAAQWTFGRASSYALAASIPWLHLGETRYHRPVRVRGLSRAAAGVLENCHPLAVREAAIRRANASMLLAGIAALATVNPESRIRGIHPAASGIPGYLRFPLRLRHGIAGFANRTAAQRLGIAPGYPQCLADLPAVRDRMETRSGADRFPGARTLVNELVTFPTHSLVSSEDREEMLRLLRIS